MIVHQISNSYKNYNYNAFIYKKQIWDRHFHGNYELIYVFDDKILVTANDESITLCRGELLLIPPYTIHSLDIGENARAWVAVFSEDFIVSFAEKNKTAEFGKFRCETVIEDFLIKNLFFQGKPEHYRLIACLYTVCGECVKNAVIKKSRRNGEFMYQIIEYISENISENITLESIAADFGYERHYFSSLFHECFSMNFKSFINIFRFENACRLLSDKKLNITHIASVCGFGSIRNFNRIFKNMCGLTPCEYRKKSSS